MSRRDRRAADPIIQAKREQHQLGNTAGGSGPLGNPGIPGVTPSKPSGGGGWGVGNVKSQPASGHQPAANPFMIPKPAGLNVVSQTFPSNYYVDWNLATWRAACDQAIKQGYTMAFATMVSWVFESSPFVQSLFRAIESPIGKIPFLVVDEKGKELPAWTEELCNKSWHKDLRKQVALSHFWGFVGLNFDPINGKVYKYPMQDIDPINRMLKQGTYSFFDGLNFADHDNLLFVQPSTAYEAFLGWMQPIARMFIQMNINDTSWVAAGRRLAFPVLTIGYPQNGTVIDEASGAEYNPFKLQAEEIASNLDPTKGLVYPYTIDDKNQIQKSVEIEFEKTSTAAKAHAIFSDFNEDKKNEIREMILGGTLTSSTAKTGSRSMGEVHQDKLETIIEDISEFVENYMNDEFLTKIRKFYKNMPEGVRFVANKAKQMSVEDIKSLSDVLVANGKRLTDGFFEANGLVKEFFEDAPTPAAGKPIEDTDFAAVIQGMTALQSKKKF